MSMPVRLGDHASRFLIGLTGTPGVTTDSGQLSAATVVIQQVVVHPDATDVWILLVSA
jgi:hypothetical protein